MRRALVAFAAAAVTGAGVFAARHRGEPAASAAALSPGTPARVGLLLYRPDAIACRPERDRLRVEVTLFRADATQTFASTEGAALRVRDANGDGYAPLETASLACDGSDDCVQLDPGNSRLDRIVFAIPAGTRAPLRFEVEGGAREAGPRVAAWPFACDPFSGGSWAAPRR